MSLKKRKKLSPFFNFLKVSFFLYRFYVFLVYPFLQLVFLSFLLLSFPQFHSLPFTTSILKFLFFRFCFLHSFCSTLKLSAYSCFHSCFFLCVQPSFTRLSLQSVSYNWFCYSSLLIWAEQPICLFTHYPLVFCLDFLNSCFSILVFPTLVIVSIFLFRLVKLNFLTSWHGRREWK